MTTENPHPPEQAVYNPYPPQMTAEQYAQMQLVKDKEHLRLLAILHYVMAGLNALGIVFLVIHYFFMKKMMMFVEAEAARAQAAAAASGSAVPGLPVGVMDEAMQGLMILYIIGALMTVAFVIANIVAGRFLAKAKGRVYCMVISALNCLFIPLGTLLGIFTFVVLCRNSVVQFYHDVGMKRGLGE